MTSYLIDLGLPFYCLINMKAKKGPQQKAAVLVGDGGFEPPKAKPADLQSVPFGHSGNPPYELLVRVELVDGLEPPTC